MSAAWAEDPYVADPDEAANDDERVEILLYRLKRKQQQLQAKKDQHRAWVSRYDDWLERESKPLAESITFLEEQVRSFMLARLEANPRAKSWRLPSGTIRSFAGRESVKVEDVAAFEDWCAGQERPTDFARWDCKPNAAEVKRHIHATGEQIPGVELVAGETSVKVVFDGGDEDE